MAKLFGDVKVTQTEVCNVNGIPSEIFEFRKLKNNAWVFAGRVSVSKGKNAHQRAYEKWLDLDDEE